MKLGLEFQVPLKMAESFEAVRWLSRKHWCSVVIELFTFQ